MLLMVNEDAAQINTSLASRDVYFSVIRIEVFVMGPVLCLCLSETDYVGFACR